MLIIEDIFSSGFSSWLKSELFSDITIILENTPFKLHKLILAYQSTFFQQIFQKNKNITEFKLELLDHENIFPNILEFIYSGKIEINVQTGIPILEFADKLGIERLRNKAAAYVRRNTTRETVNKVLAQASKHNLQDIVDKCIFLIAKNFWLLKDNDFTWIEFPLFLQLMSHEQLAVKEEISVYTVICKYVSSHEKDLSQEQIYSLMQTIRFPFLTLEQLNQAKNNLSVPKDLLIEGLMLRLRELESPRKISKENESNIRFQPRPPCGFHFEYQKDFDTNGIIYYIGTFGKKKTFANPAKDSQSQFKIYASSIEKGDPLDLTSRSTPQFWTRDIPSSWVIFDFGENRTVTLNYYTLMHGGNYRADTLRNWDIQGSNDKQSWKVLRQHRNDDSLDGKFATCSWRITQNLDKDFRYIRLLQTGYNSTHHNFLVLAGVEFYGELFELN
eukprot:Anaeramoba_ignava/a676_24.p1 GENE.a676_24~~a676_24.p1  ORF type:complete len:480 (-),score=133.29 a676_24:29-1363(-)